MTATSVAAGQSSALVARTREIDRPADLADALAFADRFDSEVMVERFIPGRELTVGVVEVRDQKLILTDQGRPFLRNACMFFDQRLRQQEQRPQIFSQAL